MIIVQVIFCLILIAISVHMIRACRNKRFYQLLKQFPSYPSYPLIGNIHMLMGSYKGILERFEKLMQPNDRLIFWFGSEPCLILKKHDDIATVLNQSQSRDSFQLIDEWLGTGLISARYEEWKTSKKILSPAFSSDMLLKYVEVFNRTSSNLVKNLKLVADTGEQIDVLHWMMIGNFDAFAGTALGITVENGGKPGKDFCNGLLEGFKHVLRRIRWPFLLSRHVNLIYLKITGKIKDVDHIKHLPTEILREKLKSHNDHQHQSNEGDGDNVDSSAAMIDILIKNSSKESSFTETRMRDEILQIIVSGIESTTQVTSFLMLMLAIHQDIQQKAYAEIIQLTPDNETLSENHLNNNLEYLDQCVKETVRMFSPAMSTSRRTHKEILLNDNTIIPKDMLVLAFLHLAHQDLHLYENPQKFDPGHFSKDAVEQRPKTSNIYFGYGPRFCIGYRYAMMSVKTQIAYILRSYHLSTNIKEFTKHHLTADIAIKSKIGYPIKFTSRSEK